MEEWGNEGTMDPFKDVYTVRLSRPTRRIAVI